MYCKYRIYIKNIKKVLTKVIKSQGGIMKTYNVSITDISGNVSELKLSIDERKQQGVLEWPIGISNLIKLRVTDTRDRIQCWIKWPSFNLRCIISADQSQIDSTIHIYLAGRRYSYFISNEDYNIFLDFINNLSLPIKEKYKEHYEKKEIAVEFENDLNKVELIRTHISLFVAWHPISEIDMEFMKITVNSRAINELDCFDLPGDQGFYIPMGFYKKNKDLLIAWEFRTNYVHEPAKIIIGVFRNGSLRKRTILKEINIELFETYSDSASVVV